jgi:hypothetical protein
MIRHFTSLDNIPKPAVQYETIELDLESSSPVTVLQCMSLLDVDGLSDSEFPQNSDFWLSRVSFAVTNFSAPLSADVVEMFIWTSFIAVRMSARLDSDRPIEALLDRQFAAPGDIDPPDEWMWLDRSRCTTFATVWAYFGIFGDIRPPDRYDFLRRPLWFFGSASELVEAANDDFFRHSDDSAFSYEEIAHFCIVRYFWEELAGAKMPRLFPDPIELTPDSALSHFVYYNVRPIPFSPGLSHQILFLALLSGAITDECDPDLSPSANAALAAHFLPSVRKALNSGTFLPNLITSACNIAAAAMPPLHLLAFQSSRGIVPASLALLKMPEAAPLLTCASIQHRLLKIFFQPPDEVEVETVDCPTTIEGAGELFWHRRLPSDASECLALFWNVYDSICGLTFATAGVHYASSFSGVPWEYIRLPPTRETFFVSDGISLLAAIVFKLFTKCPDILAMLPASALTDLRLHPATPEELIALLPPPVPSRVVFWAVLSLHDAPLKFILAGQTISCATELFEALLALGDLRTIEHWRRHHRPAFARLPLADLALPALVAWTGAAPSEFIDALGNSIATVWALLAGDRGDTAIRAIEAMPIDRMAANAILLSIPAIITSPAMQHLARLLVPFFPRSILPQKAISARLNWPEDRLEREAWNGNPWNERPVEAQCERQCDRRRPAFLCFDCGRRDLLCLSCALHCHRGHEVSWGKFCEFSCKCEACRTGEVASRQRTLATGRQPAPTGPLLRMFVGLANASGMPPVRVIQAKMSESWGSVLGRRLHMRNVAPRVGLRQLGCKIADPAEFAGIYADRKYAKFYQERMLPLRLVIAHKRLVFVAAGYCVRVFCAPGMGFLGEQTVLEPPIGVLCSTGGRKRTLVIVSLFGFELFRFSGGGRLTKSWCHFPERKVPIMNFEFLKTGHLAIVFRDRIALFDVEKEGWMETVTPEARERINSAVFFEFAGNLFAIIAFDVAKTGIARLLAGESKISRYVQWQLPLQGMRISASDAGILFVTAPGVTMHMFKIADVFEGSPHSFAQVVFDNNQADLIFLASPPKCQSFMIFETPSTGKLHVCEFTNREIETFSLGIGSGISLFGRPHEIYGWAKTDKSFIIVQGDGTVAVLEPNESTDQDVDGEDDDANEYSVPLTFWTSATIATTENSEITGTDPSQNYNSLYNDSVAYFHTGIVDKVLTFRLKDPRCAIMGIMLSFGDRDRSYRPPYVLVKGRRYCTKYDKTYLLPLAPDEVQVGADLSIVFPRKLESDMAIQGAVIFIMRAEQIEKFIMSDFRKLPWFANPSDLLDFADRRCPESDGARWTGWQVVSTLNPTAADEVEPELVEALVRIMYQNQDFSLLARGAIVRLMRVKPDLIRNWALGLKQILLENAVPENLWEFVWRDYSLFERELRKELQDAIWSGTPALAGVALAVCAFGQV